MIKRSLRQACVYCLTLGILVANAVQAVEIRFEKNIDYLGAERAEKMDAYLPASDEPLPAVLWIHGGGWVGGDKLTKREKTICKELAL